VIVIVVLAARIASQAKASEGAVDVVRSQTTELAGIGRINDSGVRILHAARHDGWEGLILKEMSAKYESGKRSPWWRKVKLEHEQEFVIGGYTLPTEGVARELGALLVGYYDEDGDLRYAGKVGTGYTRKTLEMLGRKLTPLVKKSTSFANVPRAGMANAVWVKPKLVAQVKYNEMTEGGVLRQPSYLGLRDDKRARDVRLEADTSSKAILDALDCGAAAR
jgi:bifunctional non-homologous end joining protein LigD